MLGTKLFLKTPLQAKREKIIGGSTRFKEIMNGLFDIWDSHFYLNNIDKVTSTLIGGSLYRINDLGTKQDSRLWSLLTLA